MRNRSAIIGYAALTLILTAGAAQGLAGTNTVTSDDIVNETIKSSDVMNESLTGSDIKNKSLTGADIQGFRKVHSAHVDADGDREGGDAISADRISTGAYEVRFSGFNVTRCVWSGSEADFPDGSSLSGKRRVVSVKSDSDTDEVRVFITATDAGVRANASFALIGVCL